VSALGHVGRALPDLFRVGFAGVVAYRAEMVIWILSATLPLVMLALWNAVAADGPVAGMTELELTRYFVATLLVRQLTSLWLLWELNYDIRSGRLSTLLLKPMNPLVQYATNMIVAIPMRLVVLAPMIVLLVAWRPDVLRIPSAFEVVAFGIALTAAWILNFLIQALFAIFSFWIDKSDALFGVWFGLYSLLSGYLAPLDLFPPWARDILRWLPFRGMLGTPVEIACGLLTPAEAALDLGILLGWTALLAAAVVGTWKIGLRRFGAFGA
jgi:ABC-2 type transport system permease protein